MNIFLLCGSFRENSLNRTLLNTIKDMLHEHQCIEFPIEQLPFFDAHNKNDTVIEFLESIAKADALIIVSPEFNHSIPAVLKNAIDWASLPAFTSTLKHLPATIFSATPSSHGGVLFQDHMKDVLDSMLCLIFPHVAYCLGNANEKIIHGKLIDDTATSRLDRHVHAFIEWANQHKR